VDTIGLKRPPSLRNPADGYQIFFRLSKKLKLSNKSANYRSSETKYSNNDGIRYIAPMAWRLAEGNSSKKRFCFNIKKIG